MLLPTWRSGCVETPEQNVADIVGGHITREVGPTTLVGLARTVPPSDSSTAGSVARRDLILEEAVSPSLTSHAVEWDGKSGSDVEWGVSIESNPQESRAHYFDLPLPPELPDPDADGLLPAPVDVVGGFS